MDRPSYGDTQPIAALATSLAESALALIRSSGEGSVASISRIFSRPKVLLNAPGHSIVHGWIMDEKGNRIDEVLASVFRAPNSYTGEDCVDLSCHGGIAATRAVMEALKAAGFRQALPGEFTFRGFINGKMDLTRAESVMELVAAKTNTARSHAVDRLMGELEEEIRSISELILRALSACELYLDYSEDDGVSLSATDITRGEGTGIDLEAAGLLPDRHYIEEARLRLEKLAASYNIERLYNQGATVAVAGRPNAGKSSLFNRLLKSERSIVSEIPGTTRDWIEAWISIEDVPIRLVDTAGLRYAEDMIEQIGVERSRTLLSEADLILYVLDGKQGIDPEDLNFIEAHKTSAEGDNKRKKKPPLLILWNKVDLAPLPQGVPERLQLLALSARTGEGIQFLAERIIEILEKKDDSGWTQDRERLGIASERQKALIDRALGAIKESLELADRNEPLDLIAPTLREGLDALGEITGEVSTADILETMFGRFCIGK